MFVDTSTDFLGHCSHLTILHPKIENESKSRACITVSSLYPQAIAVKFWVRQRAASEGLSHGSIQSTQCSQRPQRNLTQACSKAKLLFPVLPGHWEGLGSSLGSWGSILSSMSMHKGTTVGQERRLRKEPVATPGHECHLAGITIEQLSAHVNIREFRIDYPQTRRTRSHKQIYIYIYIIHSFIHHGESGFAPALPEAAQWCHLFGHLCIPRTAREGGGPGLWDHGKLQEQMLKETGGSRRR